MTMMRPTRIVPRVRLNNVTPFTYRDGYTFLELIEELREWATEVFPKEIEGIIDVLVDELEKASEQYEAGVDEFQRIHDAFMADVNTALMALNDNAVADLVGDEGSLLGGKLREVVADLAGDEGSLLGDKLREVFPTKVVADRRYLINVSPEMFGAIGDGVADDTQAMIDFLAYLGANGGHGWMGEATYRITSAVSINNPDKSFTITGSGKGSSVILKDGELSNGMSLVGLRGCKFTNFSIYSTNYVTSPPNMAHGIACSNTRDTVFEDIEVRGWDGTAIMIFNHSGFDGGPSHNNVISRCHANGDGRQNNGFMHEHSERSHILDCNVNGLNIQGSPSTALQLKNGCTNSTIIGGSVDGAIAAVGMGGDDSTLFGSGNIVTGVTAKNCVYGYRASRHSNCHVDMQIDMSGPDCISAINLGGNNHYNSFRVSIDSPRDSAVLVNIAGYGNVVDITNITQLGSALIARLGESSTRNLIRVGSLSDRNGITQDIENFIDDAGSVNRFIVDGNDRIVSTTSIAGVQLVSADGPAALNFFGNLQRFALRDSNGEVFYVDQNSVAPAKTEVTDLGERGRMYRDAYVSGYIYTKSPNGTRWRISVNDSGTISAEQTT